jgi:phosphoglycolate phosphatase
MNLPVPDTASAKSIIGLGLLDSTRTLFPQLDADGLVDFARIYRRLYVPRDHEAPLYPGVRELLEMLRAPACFLAVATGKPRAGLERAFAHTGLRSMFSYTRCADEGFPKPHPDMLLKLMEFTAVSAGRTLMIGDTTHDLDLARNAGVAALAISHGAHPRPALERRSALGVVDSIEELAGWMNLHA